MKKVFATLLALWAVGAMGQTTVNGKIERVTIFPNGALVEKCVTVHLQKGENKFVITGNAVWIDGGTLQFSSSPKWFISSSNMKQCNLPTSVAMGRLLPAAAYTQYQALENKIGELNLKITNNDDVISYLTQQHAALYELKAVRNTVSYDTVERIKMQFDFQCKEAKSINAALAKARKENEDYRYQLQSTQEEIDKIVSQYTGGRTFYPNQQEIEVSIWSKENINSAKIKYSYHVSNSSSNYFYDVQLDEAAHRAVFCLKSNVAQNTGEHWRDCEIVFATSEAGHAGYDRVLPTYYLDFVSNTPAVPVNTRAKYMTNAYVASRKEVAEEDRSMNSEIGYIMADVAMPSSSQNLTLSRDFVLNTRQTIASGNPAQMMMLLSDTTNATFARFATPKNEEKVHYTAMLPNWEDLGLLEVGCNVYLNDKYVSQSAIRTAGMGDTMRFAVGEDPNVKVSRRVTRTTPDRNGLFGKEVEEVVNVKLTIKNTKSEAIDISMKDQVPVSKNVDIRVLNIQTANGELDSNTGIIRWNLKLEPREERVVTFSYTVRYPKGNTVILN